LKSIPEHPTATTHIHHQSHRYVTAIRILFLCTLYSALSTIFLTACDDTSVTPTPEQTLSGPTVEPSPTFMPRQQEDEVPEEFIGISDPTAAALAPLAALPPLGIEGMTDGDRQTVEVTASDGALLVGEMYMSMAVRQPGIVLLAPDRTAWGGFAAQLHNGGFTVLVLGMRELNRVEDLEAAIQSLSQSALPDKLGVIGAGQGADTALLGCAGEGLCKALVLLSPSDSPALIDAMGRYNPRPIFLAATQEDTPSFNGITALQAATTGENFFQPLTQAGYGTALLDNRPDLGRRDRAVVATILKLKVQSAEYKAKRKEQVLRYRLTLAKLRKLSPE
jgi:hypothetical protein